MILFAQSTKAEKTFCPTDVRIVVTKFYQQCMEVILPIFEVVPWFVFKFFSVCVEGWGAEGGK